MAEEMRGWVEVRRDRSGSGWGLESAELVEVEVRWEELRGD
jgi:hypothetical protein